MLLETPPLCTLVEDRQIRSAHTLSRLLQCDNDVRRR